MRPSPCRHEGRFAVVTKRGAGCDGPLPASGVFACQTKRRRRTVKSCGPGAATLASIRAALWQRGNGGKRGRSPGRARNKPSNHCAGKAGMSWLVPVKSVCVFHYPLHTELAGAAGARPSLRPLSRGSKRVRKTQAIPRRENESAYLSPSLRGAKRRPVYACCASYAGLGVRRSSESEGGSNPALLRSPAKSAKFSCRPVQASEASAIRDP